MPLFFHTAVSQGSYHRQWTCWQNVGRTVVCLGGQWLPHSRSLSQYPIIGPLLLTRECTRVCVCVSARTCGRLHTCLSNYRMTHRSMGTEEPWTAMKTFCQLRHAGNCWDSSICKLFHKVKVGDFREGCAISDRSAEIIDVCCENALQGVRFGHNGRNVIQKNNSLLSVRDVGCNAEWSSSHQSRDFNLWHVLERNIAGIWTERDLLPCKQGCMRACTKHRR